MNALDVALFEGLADREEGRMILIGSGKVQEKLLVTCIVMISGEPVPVGISDYMRVNSKLQNGETDLHFRRCRASWLDPLIIFSFPPREFGRRLGYCADNSTPRQTDDEYHDDKTLKACNQILFIVKAKSPFCLRLLD
jgi:hypothetical protein